MSPTALHTSQETVGKCATVRSGHPLSSIHTDIPPTIQKLGWQLFSFHCWCSWRECSVSSGSSLKPIWTANCVASSPTSIVCRVWSSTARATDAAPFTRRRQPTAPTFWVSLTDRTGEGDSWHEWEFVIVWWQHVTAVMSNFKIFFFA